MLDTIQVMLVDDHRMVREGLKKILETDEKIHVISEADNGQDCLAKLSSISPDIILLDLDMPVMDGIETLRRLAELEKKYYVLILTSHAETEYFLGAVHAGATGYILKSSDSDELKRAVDCVAHGERYLTAELLPLLDEEASDSGNDYDKIRSLSDRELEVLKLVATGMFNKEIGRNLNISERTVKNHLFSIFKKLNCTDRTQAAVFAIRNHIVII